MLNRKLYRRKTLIQVRQIQTDPRLDQNEDKKQCAVWACNPNTQGTQVWIEPGKQRVLQDSYEMSTKIAQVELRESPRKNLYWHFWWNVTQKELGKLALANDNNFGGILEVIAYYLFLMTLPR